MTPLATRFAHAAVVPVSKRDVDDRAELCGAMSQDLHCFEITAIAKAVHEALEAENLWPDVEGMAPKMFLPSPVTWLEYTMPHKAERIAWALEDQGEGWTRLSMVGVGKGLFSLPMCDFRARTALEVGDRIHIVSRVGDGIEDAPKEKPQPRSRLFESVGELAEVGISQDQRLTLLQGRRDLAELELRHFEDERGRVEQTISALETAALFGEGEIEGTIKLGIAFSVLTLDLINTPGLIGLRQHDPHRGLARKLAAYRSGSYPLRGWSEVVLKHQTRLAGEAEHHTGATFHKCLHFVRSHLRHYRDGKVSVIPAHWRGDPALGIKRTRYRLAA